VVVQQSTNISILMLLVMVKNVITG